jgi:hypothetical protein
MDKLHVGSGITNGALTVFPIWSEADGERDYTTAIEAGQFSEQASPQIKKVTVVNHATRPLLVTEGQLLEGGWQNRLVSRSVLVGPNSQVAVDAVCAEAHRWNGQGRFDNSARQASTRVRAGLYVDGDQRKQNEVWKRISEYDARYGSNATSSFTEHSDRAADDVASLVRGLRGPFRGQVGIVVAISGHPVSAEVFDSPVTLSERYKSIVESAAMDSVGRPEVVTPSRRARRFIDHASAVQLRREGPAGVGVSFRGSTEYAEISVLGWMGRAVHCSLINAKHELTRAA